MDGFGLLVGHLLGDYILQEDWQAKNKVNPCPGKRPRATTWLEWRGEEGDLIERERTWLSACRAWRIGHLACTVHCLLYTLVVWACSFWWMPLWGLFVCFAVHWPIDRFRLARFWMEHISGQKAFATGPLSPWSIIVVDNTFHLLTLFGIAIAARGLPC